jgi:hypothetical protein
MLSLWSGMTTSLPRRSTAHTFAKYKGMNSLWNLLHIIKQLEEPRETKHTREKAFTGGSITMKQYSRHFKQMECSGSTKTLIGTRLTNSLP